MSNAVRRSIRARRAPPQPDQLATATEILQRRRLLSDSTSFNQDAFIEDVGDDSNDDGMFFFSM